MLQRLNLSIISTLELLGDKSEELLRLQQQCDTQQETIDELKGEAERAEELYKEVSRLLGLYACSYKGRYLTCPCGHGCGPVNFGRVTKGEKFTQDKGIVESRTIGSKLYTDLFGQLLQPV